MHLKLPEMFLGNNPIDILPGYRVACQEKWLHISCRLNARSYRNKPVTVSAALQQCALSNAECKVIIRHNGIATTEAHVHASLMQSSRQRVQSTCYPCLGADPRLESSINDGFSGFGLFCLIDVKIRCPEYRVSGAIISTLPGLGKL